MAAGGSASLSQESLLSLTAADVLVHSTGVRREKPIESVSRAGGRRGKVAIAVEKLRDGLCPCPAPRVPPALAANRAPRSRAAPGAPGSAAPAAGFTVGECSA